ncbi:MAG: MoxR family ATPase [Planctomycetes bacterium]|nr:MoxR family ATPase [Planctomycetota bacterium]
MAVEQEIKNFQARIKALKDEIGKIIVGHESVIDQVLTAVLAGGHTLLEGVPGIGKTRLVRTLAQCLNLKFSRIQFTPDLMPADITGTNLVVEAESGQKKFQFQKGPVFGNIILADEINRATPKTQSALLEAMQELNVTVAGTTYPLPEPFFVLATQNPIEMEGTYPLPEAQLDRFFFKTLVKMPSVSEMETIMDRTTGRDEIEVKPVMTGTELLSLRKLAREVPVAGHLKRYIAQLVHATHPDTKETSELVKRYVRYGASPRGTQAVMLAGKITALLKGRYNLSFADIRQVAVPALRHRLILNFEGEAEGIKPDNIIQNLLETLPELPQEVEKLTK